VGVIDSLYVPLQRMR